MAAVRNTIITWKNLFPVDRQYADCLFSSGLCGPSSPQLMSGKEWKDGKFECAVNEKILVNYALKKRKIVAETVVRDTIGSYIEQTNPEANKSNLEPLFLLGMYLKNLSKVKEGLRYDVTLTLEKGVASSQSLQFNRRQELLKSFSVKKIINVKHMDFNDLIQSLNYADTRSKFVGCALVKLPESCHVDALVFSQNSTMLLSMKKVNTNLSMHYLKAWLSIHPLLVSCNGYASVKGKDGKFKLPSRSAMKIFSKDSKDSTDSKNSKDSTDSKNSKDSNYWKDLKLDESNAFLRKFLLKESKLVSVNVFVTTENLPFTTEDKQLAQNDWKEFHEVVVRRCESMESQKSEKSEQKNSTESKESENMPTTHFFTADKNALHDILELEESGKETLWSRFLKS
ncbi:MAG: hypothetical protein LAT81_15555 [Oceanicaulis sp.]|nr:hypothetical protein [Oceanicaulis sp.]